MMQITPQRVNRGGNLAPSEVVGRDAFIGHLWGVLERQSAVLTAERRMGKTSVVKKMRTEAPQEVTAMYRTLEAVRTRKEFVEALLTDLRDQLPARMRARARLTGLLEELQTVQVGPVHIQRAPKDGWKALVQRVFSTLEGRNESLVVFFWDEIPVMLGGIAEEEGPDAAQELLHTLRVVRQTCEGVRMVFTGSIGLHHVVGFIRPDQYASAPTNDMLTVMLGGLVKDSAMLLARNLFAGERLDVDDEEKAAEAIADCTSGIPFYIQHVVGALSDSQPRRTEAIDQHAVVEIVDRALHDPVDSWEFRQYRQRIDIYYRDHTDLALAVLDALAVESQPIGVARLANLVNSRFPASEEDVRSVVELLQLDHYVVPADGGYTFAFDIVDRSWRAQRNLEAR